jgi:dTDP-glucose pyrophosphorylase
MEINQMNLATMSVNNGASIVDAMKVIDTSAKGIVFVIDERGTLVGALTDGDVRRWLMKGGSIQDTVSQAMNANPYFLPEDRVQEAKDLMREHVLTAVAICDSNKKLVDVVFKDGRRSWRIPNKKLLADVPVVIMAGGKGTRLYPYTKILPKPLIPIGDVPIMEHIIEHFHYFGCKDFRVIVNYKKNMIKAYFNELEKDYALSYVDEDEPLGTGGGLSLLRDQLDSTFILSNCDILIEDNFEAMYEHHKAQGNLVTMVCSLKNYDIPYGVVKFSEGGSIESMEEKPTVSFFTNTGCYIVEPEIFDYIPKDTFIGFPDIIQKCKEAGKKVGVYPINERAWLDMGQMDTMEQMRERLEGQE